MKSSVIIIEWTRMESPKAYLEFDPKLNKPIEDVEEFVRSQQMDWK